MTKFESDLRVLINANSIENQSNTPDFILANYLLDCLRAYNTAVNAREKHSEQKEHKFSARVNYIEC